MISKYFIHRTYLIQEMKQNKWEHLKCQCIKHIQIFVKYFLSAILMWPIRSARIKYFGSILMLLVYLEYVRKYDLCSFQSENQTIFSSQKLESLWNIFVKHFDRSWYINANRFRGIPRENIQGFFFWKYFVTFHYAKNNLNQSEIKMQ